MTYKVLIVDDEPMIRLGISSCVRWEDERFELAGEAANGEAAMQIARQQEIHILITDIKMPLMDGLELTRQVSRLYPDVKVILVSSYNDFEFAREAVKLGVVVDYLLKPTMEPEQLLRILVECRRRLDDSISRENEANLYLREIEKTKRTELEISLKKIMNGEKVVLPWASAWLKEPLIAAVWKHDGKDRSDVDMNLAKQLHIETAKESLRQWCEQAVSFNTYEDEFVLVMADKNGSGTSAIETYHRRLLSEGIPLFTVGLSPSFHHVQGLPDAYRWAQKALEKSFFHGKGKCYSGKIMTVEPKGPSSIDLSERERWIALRERFSQMLAISNQDESGNIVEQCLAEWGGQTMTKQEIIVQAESLLTMMWTWNFRQNTEEMVRRIIDKLQEVRQISTLAELCKFIRQEFQFIWETGRLPIVVTDSGSAHAIQLAISYIQQHYREELSLQDVADHVHMSKNYFSEQFKRLTGLNFIDFVIRLRIHYAKRLLKTSSLRVYDVGTQAGFNSSKHFLKQFKREVNCTPAEYRQRLALQQERIDG